MVVQYTIKYNYYTLCITDSLLYDNWFNSDIILIFLPCDKSDGLQIHNAFSFSIIIFKQKYYE